MANRKKKKAADSKARKRKKGIKFFLLILFAGVGIASLVFLYLTLSEFIESPVSNQTAPAQKKVKQTVSLFFSDSNERFLMPEKRLILKPADPEMQAVEIVKALIDGPKTDLVRTFPEDTKLLGVKIKDGTAFVNFDSNLLELHPGGSTSEIATIYSLTDTLISNMDRIKRVKILINGKERETLKGHMDTSRPFTFNKELIRHFSGTQS